MLIANMNISSNTLENIKDTITLAVNNVTVDAHHMVETVHEAHDTHHAVGHGHFYEDPTFWVAISFIVVIIGLAKPIGKILKSMLLARADKIDAKLKEARNLRDETQNLLADYKRKYKNADKHADEIIEKAKAQAEMMKKEAIAKLTAEIKLKEKETASKIKLIEKSAKDEINNLAVSLSVKAVEKVLKENMNSKIDGNLIDAAISSIPKKISLTKID